MLEYYDEFEESKEIQNTTQEVVEAESEINAEQPEETEEGEKEIKLGGACDESFWKDRAAEYYADGNISKYKECMEKAAAAIS